MALFEQTSSRNGSRFGRLSSNMFFTRNTAKPKRVRHIEGLNGALICSVNDDPSVVRSASASSLNFNRTNLPNLETPRRIERLVPPMGFWNTCGVIQDTEGWRQELASLATASGLGLEKDEQKHFNRPSTTTTDQQHASRSGAHYSTRTGRFNEGTTKSRGRTGSKHATAYSDILFNVPENEREMWMLQVLCQLLGTSNLEDVQSWLVSASSTEKEQARTMINSALQGLKESERTSNQTNKSVDLNTLTNFVEKQKNEEKQASQKYIKESLNRPLSVSQTINEEQQTDDNLNDLWSDLSPQNSTTYKRSYSNYNRRSFSSFDTPSSLSNNQNQHENDNKEQIDTTQIDENHQRPQSESLTKTPKQTIKLQTPLRRSVTSYQQKHQVESLQFNDDNNNENENITFPSIKNKELSDQNDDIKTRKIRELQTKLSRQEEEAKKQLNELQTKQIRLENALKLLTKQTSSYGKRRQQTHDNTEKDLDAPVVNVFIESQKENDRRHQEINSSSDKQTKITNINKNRDGNNRVKIGDYDLDNVNIQLNLSRLDIRPTRSYSGIWKPDASTLHRLQGN